MCIRWINFYQKNSMTWGWTARGPLPPDGRATGTTGGGEIERATKAWPRYEAEYLKKALQSTGKYDTAGLDETQKQIYLDRVVDHYKEEADEVLKAEFEQWLEGRHEVNFSDSEYENGDGKPVRRWVMRTQEDCDGASKVGGERHGWKHTPWGRAQLTHLPGVREYLRSEKESGARKDLDMQLLAEFGPQNLEQSWLYFKHWVKGRPYSDAVATPGLPAVGERTYGHQQPDRFHSYDPDPQDRQPGVRASETTQSTRLAVDDEMDRTLQWREMREALEGLVSAKREIRDRAERAEKRDVEEVREAKEKAIGDLKVQEERHLTETAPVLF